MTPEAETLSQQVADFVTQNGILPTIALVLVLAALMLMLILWRNAQGNVYIERAFAERSVRDDAKFQRFETKLDETQRKYEELLGKFSDMRVQVARLEFEIEKLTGQRDTERIARQLAEKRERFWFKAATQLAPPEKRTILMDRFTKMKNRSITA